MRNILLLLKILDGDYKLNYKKILVYLNFGIFLCWGCLVAAYITGAFETRLENRVSEKNTNVFLKNSLDQMSNFMTNEVQLLSNLETFNLYDVIDVSRLNIYLSKIITSYELHINYLDSYNNSKTFDEEILAVKDEILILKNLTDKIILKWDTNTFDEAYNKSEDIRISLFALYLTKSKETSDYLQDIEREALDYNNWSSLTFIITFIIQLFIFMFIQSFEVSLERRKIKENE